MSTPLCALRSLLFLFALLAAACSGGGGPEPGEGTATVLVGLRPARQAAALPGAVTRVSLTVSAPDMSPATASLPLDGSVISLDLPAGFNRVFACEAFEGANVSHRGSTTVAQLVAGSRVRVSITLNPVGPDTTPPAVASSLPAAGATGVAVNTAVSVTFSEAVDPASMRSSFTLAGPGGPVAGSVAVTGATASFTPAAALAFETVYTATVGTGARDLAGNALPGAFSWTFTTGRAPDATPPAVVSTVPADGAGAAPISTSVTITFSEPVDPVTVTGATFTLAGPAGSVPGEIAVTGATAAFTPSALVYGGAYTATVTTGVRDLAGNPLASTFSWAFTVEPAPDDTPPAVVSTLPADGATGVAVGTAVNVVFSEAMDPASLTAATFTLSSGAGPVAGSVTYDAPFRAAVFTPGVPLARGTAYTATVTVGARDLAGNGLAAPATFTFTTGGDLTPPAVVSSSPEAGAVGASTRASVTVTFSEAVVPATVTADSFLLRRFGEFVDVSGAVGYDEATRTATFTPSVQLAFGSNHEVTVTTAVTDLAGNALPAPASFGFTTRSFLAAFSPGSSGPAPVDSTVTFTFDPELGADNDAGAALSLTTAAGAPVAGTPSFDPATRTWTFRPSLPLEPGTEYLASVTVLRGPDGLGGTREVSAGWAFTTAASVRGWGREGPVSVGLAGDATLPRVAMDPAGNAVAVWVESANGRPSIWARRYDAAADAWGPAVTLEGDDAVTMARPRAAMDEAGNAVAVWNDFVLPPAGPQPGTVYAAVYTAASGSWGAPFVLAHSDSACLTTGGVSLGGGRATAVWSSCGGGVSTAIFAGPADLQIADLTALAAGSSCEAASGPDVASGVGGDAVVVWESAGPRAAPDGYRYLCASRLSAPAGGVWDAPSMIDQHVAPSLPDGESLEADVAMDSVGNAAVAWRRWNPFLSLYGVSASRFDVVSGTWGPVTTLGTPTPSGSAASPSVAADGLGGFFVTWRQPNTTGLSDVFAERFPSGSGWAEVSGPPTDARLPRVAADAAGNAVVVFSDRRDGARFDLSFARFSGAGWEAPALVETTDTGDARLADVAGNAAGDAVAVWSQGVATKTFVYGNVYRFPNALPAHTPPSVTAGPLDVMVAGGETAVFGVEAAGSRSFSYQWLRGGFELPGETAAFLVLPAVTLADDGALLGVVVVNDAGSATSAEALLTVYIPAGPSIVDGPASQTVAEGAPTTFTVVVDGTPPFNFQWRRNGANIPGATGQSYVIPSTSTVDDGAAFSVTVTNAIGSAEGGPALLTVTDAIQPAVAASRGFRPTVDVFYAALGSRGEVFTWGMDLYGGLGNGAATGTTTAPGQVDGLPAIHRLQAGGDFVLAVDRPGNLWAWGRNDLGQLGDGTGTDQSTPVRLAGLANIVRVGAGVDHALAVDRDGRVFAWGSNEFGQLGLGTTGGTQGTPVPVPLPPGAPVIDVAAGLAHSLALRADGTVLAWGANGNGQLGDGTTVSRPTPAPVPGLSGVGALAAGARHSMAAVSFGTEGYFHLRVWGANEVGQLGTGDAVDRASPSPMRFERTWTPVVGTHEAFLAVVLGSEGNELVTWGLNDCGQVGRLPQGVCLVRNSDPPVLEPARGSWPPASSVSSGIRHSILRNPFDGGVWVWGLAPDGVTTVTTRERVPGFTLN